MHQAVEYFRKRAKALLSDVEHGDNKAATRVSAVLHQGVQGFGLMKAQHVVAVESGFETWNRLIEAPDMELRLVITMTEHHYLDAFGINFTGRHRDLSREQRLAKLQEDRAQLRRSVKDVEWTVSWLRANIEPTKTINKERSSYGLKHIAEPESPGKYLTNGVFIAAAIIAGYPYKILDDSPNVLFGMSETSIAGLRNPRFKRAARDPSSFTGWISRHTKRNSPLGDLAGDWMHDGSDAEPATRDELLSYLTRRGAGSQVLDIARSAWRTYSAWKARPAQAGAPSTIS